MDFHNVYYTVKVEQVQIIDVNTKDNLPSFKDSGDIKTKGIFIKSTDVVFYPYEGSKINISKSKSLKSEYLAVMVLMRHVVIQESKLSTQISN